MHRNQLLPEWSTREFKRNFLSEEGQGRQGESISTGAGLIAPTQ